jgi:hypothetical protein
MQSIRETNLKAKYVYHDTRARYGRPADTIIIRVAITPTGRESKYWATIRLNADYFGAQPSETTLQTYAKKMNLPRLPKGYTWTDPYLY